MIDPQIFNKMDDANDLVAKLMGASDTPTEVLIELDDIISTYIENKSPQQLSALLLNIIILIELIAGSNHSNDLTAAATARLIKTIVDDQLTPYKMSLIRAGMYGVDFPIKKSHPITLQSNIIYN